MINIPNDIPLEIYPYKHFFSNYSIDEYSFLDSLESLGEFRVTYSFLKNRLYKGTYTKELKENDKSFKNYNPSRCSYVTTSTS